jgi:hypothetical protein
MNIFTANQVNQVYVANAYKASKLAKTDAVGTITVGKNSVENAIYVQQIGAGGLQRSDLIDVNKILYAKATKASAMARKLKVATVTLDSNVNGGAPVAGQDYILRIAFTHVISISPENQYWKYGAVHAYKNMTASDFYKTMALSIAKNMSREAVKLVAVYLGNTEVTPETKESDLNGSYSSIIIKEVEQDWILGIKQQRPVQFTVEPTNIKVDGEEVIWGKTAYSDGATIGNGKEMADYEYFYMGERGDQYRMVNWPNYVPTKYLVDPTKEYDTIAIHFAYTGANHSVQMSEKDITILVPADATVGSGENAASLTNTIIAAINTAVGSTVIAPLA